MVKGHRTRISQPSNSEKHRIIAEIFEAFAAPTVQRSKGPRRLSSLTVLTRGSFDKCHSDARLGAIPFRSRQFERR